MTMHCIVCNAKLSDKLTTCLNPNCIVGFFNLENRKNDELAIALRDLSNELEQEYGDMYETYTRRNEE